MLLAIKNDLVFSFYLEGYSYKPRLLYLMEPDKRFANLEHICLQPFQAFYKHEMFFAALLLGEGTEALGIASCPEWCSSCCTGIFQHTWIATAEFIAFPGREGGWEDCQ